MPANVLWHDEKRGILHMIVQGEWLVEEWLSTARDASLLAASIDIDQSVCLIIEYRVPPDYRAPNLLRHLGKITHSPIATNNQIIRIVIFGEQDFQKTARNIFLRIYKMRKVRYVDTWEEALSEALFVLSKN